MQLTSFFKRGLLILLVSCFLVILQIRTQGWRSPLAFFTNSTSPALHKILSRAEDINDGQSKFIPDVAEPSRGRQEAEEVLGKTSSREDDTTKVTHPLLPEAANVRIVEWSPNRMLEKAKPNDRIVEYQCDTHSCVDCKGYANESCAKCYTIDGETGVFALHNVAFTSGRPLLFGKTLSGSKAQKCYTNCASKKEAGNHCATGPSYGLFALSNVFETRLLNNVKNVGDDVSTKHCEAFKEIAIVVTDHSMQMFFHFILERMYELFTFMGAISEKHGCVEKSVNVFFAKMEAKRAVTDLWEAMFGQRKEYKRMEGCYNTVYYGVPWKGGRISNNAGGQTSIFEYNHRNSFWASLFGMKSRAVWQIPNVPQTNLSMLILRHSRTPIWFWNMNFTYDGVVHIAGEFENKPMSYQVKTVSQSRGIISAEGAGFVWQIFLRPRSALFSLSLNLIAMNRKSDNLLPWAQWCHERPGCVHDVWAAHLGHSILSWRWCHPWPFQRNKTISRNIAITALKWLMAENEKAREQNYAWICHVLERQDLGHIEKFIRKEVSMNFCDKEIRIHDRDLDAYRDSNNPDHQDGTCGAFGKLGPSLLSTSKRFTCNVAKNAWGAICKDKVDLGCGGLKCSESASRDARW